MASLLLVATLAPLQGAETRIPEAAPSADSEDLRVVDLHAHAFNLRHLPVYGILRSRGVPGVVASLLEWVLVAFTDGGPIPTRLEFAREEGGADTAGPPELPPEDPDALARSIARTARARLEELEARREGPSRPSALEAEGDPFDNPTFRRGLNTLDLETAVEIAPTEELRRLLVRRVLTMGSVGPNDGHWSDPQIAALLRSSPADFEEFVRRVVERGLEGGNHDLFEMLAFLHRLQKREDHIALDAFRKFEHLDRAVFLAVDLDPHYAGRPRLRYPTSLARMQEVVDRLGSRAIWFVPFDPARPNSLDHVKAAIRRGARGVKLYPPSGFFPLSVTDSPVRNPPSWDARLRELYEYLQKERIPLFTHCTAGGFLADPDSNAGYGSPHHWYRVLDVYPRLRLILGHAGAYEDWATRPGPTDYFPTSLAGHAFELATTEESVYLDFGNHYPILDAEKRDAFGARLEWCIDKSSREPERRDFSKRICYGSDFPMISTRLNHQRYLEAFRFLFRTRDGLRPYAADFFAGNAETLLDLPQAAQETRRAGR